MVVHHIWRSSRGYEQRTLSQNGAESRSALASTERRMSGHPLAVFDEFGASHRSKS